MNNLIISRGSGCLDWNYFERQSDINYINCIEKLPYGQWNTTNHLCFPIKVQKRIFMWLLIAKRLQLPNELIMLICEWIVTRPKEYYYWKDVIHNNW